MLSRVSQSISTFLNKCGFGAHLFLAVLLTLLLSACGGGGGGGSSSSLNPAPRVVLNDVKIALDSNDKFVVVQIDSTKVNLANLGLGPLMILLDSNLFGSSPNNIPLNVNTDDVSVAVTSFQGSTDLTDLTKDFVVTFTASLPSGLTVTATDGRTLTITTPVIVSYVQTVAFTLVTNHLAAATVSTTKGLEDYVDIGLVSTRAVQTIIATNTVTQSFNHTATEITGTNTYITSTLFTLTSTTSLTYFDKDNPHHKTEYTLTVVTTLTQTANNIPLTASIVGTITNTISTPTTVTTYNATKGTITVVNVTGLVHKGADGNPFIPSEVFYGIQDVDGNLSYIDAYDYYRMVAQGVTLPGISFTITVGSGTSTLEVDVSTYIYTVAVTNTVNKLISVTVTVGTTSIAHDVYTITTGTQFTTTYTATITATITNSIALNLSNYYLLTNFYTAPINTLTIDVDYGYDNQSYGITLGYDIDGQVGYLILPKSSSTSAVDYDTSEYRESWGLANIQARAAYERGYFGEGVTVAIVDSGVKTNLAELDGNIVPGVRYESSSNKFFTTNITDLNGHGTFIAGIIAGELDGSAIHGVAPSASILPVQTDAGDGFVYGQQGQQYLLTTKVAAHQVQIINNSWGSRVNLYGTYKGQTVLARLPLFKELIDLNINPDYKNYESNAKILANQASDQDIILVYSAGNDYWNTETEKFHFCESLGAFALDYKTCGTNTETPHTYVSTEKFLRNFESLAHTVNLGGHPYEYYGYGELADLAISPNSPGYEGITPWYDNRLLGKMVVVVATDANNDIATFSNGCGEAKMWCMAAPGVTVKSFDLNGNITVGNGTSYAAPHVSGALAVLKSRLPLLPMSVVLDMLFYTATDLGKSGVDEVYGHGLLNLDLAIQVQGSISFVGVQEKLVDATDRVGNPMTLNISLVSPNSHLGTDYASESEYTPNLAAHTRVGLAVALDRGYTGDGSKIAYIGHELTGNGANNNLSFIAGNQFTDAVYNPAFAGFDGTSGVLTFDRSVLGKSSSGDGHFYGSFINARENTTDILGVAPNAQIYNIAVDTSDASQYRGISRESVLNAVDFVLTTTLDYYAKETNIVYAGWVGGYNYNYNYDASNAIPSEHYWYEKLYGKYESPELTATILLSYTPTTPEFIESGLSHNSSLTAVFRKMADSEREFAWVVPAEAFNWHQGGYVFACAASDVRGIRRSREEGLNCGGQGGNLTLDVEDVIAYFDADVDLLTVESNAFDDFIHPYGQLSTLGISPNNPGVWALAPYFEKDLIGRYIVAVGLDEIDLLRDSTPVSGNINNWKGPSNSSACGIAKNWCLAAPSKNIVAADRAPGTATKTGNAFAASYVSGALALLSEKNPSSPIETNVAILFETATDIGARGIDEVFGHGLLNISAAINLSGNQQLILYNATQTVPTPVLSLSAASADTGSDFANSNSSGYKDFAVNAESLNMINANVALDRGYYGKDSKVAMLGPLPAIAVDNNSIPNLSRRGNETYDEISGRIDRIISFLSNDPDKLDSLVFADGTSISSRQMQERANAGYYSALALGASFGNEIRDSFNTSNGGYDVLGVAPEARFVHVVVEKGGANLNNGASNKQPYGVMRESVLEATRFMATTYAAEHRVDIVNNHWIAHAGFRYENDFYNTQPRWFENMAGVYESTTLTATVVFTHIPSMVGLLDTGKSHNSSLTALFKTMAKGVREGRDMVWVYGAEDYNWHDGAEIVGCDISDVNGDKYTSGNSGAVALAPGCFGASNNYTIEISDFIANFNDNITTSTSLTFDGTDFSNLFRGYGDLSTLSLTVNSPGVFALAPLYEPDLIGSYVVAVGVDQSISGTVTSYALHDAFDHKNSASDDELVPLKSSACGVAKHWCVAAPAEFKTAVAVGSVFNVWTSNQQTYKGNSIAASFVSGALAVLRERHPNQPMSVAVAILFDTATDIGAPGVDDEFGHGLLNIGAAITLSGMQNLVLNGHQIANEYVKVYRDGVEYLEAPVEADLEALSPKGGGALLMQTKGHLPAALSGLSEALANQPIAVEYIQGRYYNMPLSNLFEDTDTAGQMDVADIGNAAHDVLQTEGSQQTEMWGSFSLVQDADDGRLLNIAYDNDTFSMQYNLCANCDNVNRVFDGLGADSADIDSYQPYFLNLEQNVAMGFGLSDSWTLLGGMGFTDDIQSDLGYQQYGLRYQRDIRNIGSVNHLRWWGEWTRITEAEGKLFGGEYSGGLELQDGAVTDQYRFGFNSDLSNQWSLSGDYEMGIGRVEGMDGTIFDSIEYRYQGYRFGVQRKDMMRQNDVFRFGIRRHSNIDSGRANLNSGSQMLVDGVLVDLPSHLSWSEDSLTSVHLGYGFRPDDSTEWALGLEHARQADEKNTAASFLWKYRF